MYIIKKDYIYMMIIETSFWGTDVYNEDYLHILYIPVQ